jgi:hypothetical protein
VPWSQRLCPHCLPRCNWKIALIALFHMYNLMLFIKLAIVSIKKKKKSVANKRKSIYYVTHKRQCS